MTQQTEIRSSDVHLVGRMAKDAIQTKDGLVHFLFEASWSQAPFHCVCQGVTGTNLLKNCRQGDELSIEGKLMHINFPNTGKTLVIFAEFTSYGRKLQTLR